MKQVDYIIVGQGLAGSCLAQALWHEKQSVVVIAGKDQKASSAVAAGLYNPITGKKMVLTWNAAVLFPSLHAFYRTAEADLQIKILYPKAIVRPFTDIQAQNDFWTKSTPEIAAFAEPELKTEKYEPYVWFPHGGLVTKHSGYVDVQAFLQAVKLKLIGLDGLLEETFDYNALKFTDTNVEYKGIQAKKIIFAEGFHNRNNPFFNWVPVNGMKGDVLTLDIQDYPLDEVINKHFFIIPLPNGKFRMGSSYIREFEDDAPTETGLKEITQGAHTILKKPFVVVEQKAGIRPVVPDHRPIIGAHPELPLAIIFNGLGTKGVSIAPFASKIITNFLILNQQIDESVSVNRFNYLYFKQKNK